MRERDESKDYMGGAGARGRLVQKLRKWGQETVSGVRRQHQVGA